MREQASARSPWLKKARAAGVSAGRNMATTTPPPSDERNRRPSRCPEREPVVRRREAHARNDAGQRRVALSRACSGSACPPAWIPRPVVVHLALLVVVGRPSTATIASGETARRPACRSNGRRRIAGTMPLPSTKKPGNTRPGQYKVPRTAMIATGVARAATAMTNQRSAIQRPERRSRSAGSSSWRANAVVVWSRSMAIDADPAIGRRGAGGVQCVPRSPPVCRRRPDEVQGSGPRFRSPFRAVGRTARDSCIRRTVNVRVQRAVGTRVDLSSEPLRTRGEAREPRRRVTIAPGPSPQAGERTRRPRSREPEVRMVDAASRTVAEPRSKTYEYVSPSVAVQMSLPSPKMAFGSPSARAGAPRRRPRGRAC